MRYAPSVLKSLVTGGLLVLLLGLAACHGPVFSPESAQLDPARRAFLDGRYLEAEQRYQYYLQSFPKGSHRLEAWLRLVDVSQDIRNAKERAAGLLSAALLEFGQDPRAAPAMLLRLGGLRLALKDYAKATASYQQLLALPGADAPSLFAGVSQLARTRLLAGDPDGALAVYDQCRALPLPPGDAQRCALSKASLLLRRDRPREAESILQSLYAAPDTQPVIRAEAGFALGQLSESRQDKAKAKVYYQTIRDSYPNPPVIDQRLSDLH